MKVGNFSARERREVRMVMLKSMEGQVIYPPAELNRGGKLVFLAGPIQGTGDWQKEAIRILRETAPEVNIANPRRGKLENDFDYAEQVDWETRHLAQAGRDGVIFFWLARETVHDPRRAYAQTSRLELGEWMSASARNEAQLVVGIEEGFFGARYIRHRMAQKCPGAPLVINDMEAALAAVVGKLNEPA